MITFLIRHDNFLQYLHYVQAAVFSYYKALSSSCRSVIWADRSLNLPCFSEEALLRALQSVHA